MKPEFTGNRWRGKLTDPDSLKQEWYYSDTSDGVLAEWYRRKPLLEAAKAARREHRKKGGTSIEPIITYYVDVAKKKLAEKTKIKARGILRKLEYLRDWESISTETIIEAISTKSATPDPFPSTIASNVDHMRRFVNYCEKVRKFSPRGVDWDLAQQTLVSGDKRKREKRFFSPEEIKMLEDYLVRRGLRHLHAMWSFQWSFGSRVGATVEMKIRDWDMENNTIKLVPEHDKTKKKITVPIGREMSNRIELSIAARLGPDHDKWNPDYPLFASPKNPEKHLTTAGMQVSFKKMCKRAGIQEEKNIHLLRSYAFYLVYNASGFNLEATKALIGWDSTAYKHYSPRWQKEKEDIAKSIFEVAESLTSERSSKPFCYDTGGKLERFGTLEELERFVRYHQGDQPMFVKDPVKDLRTDKLVKDGVVEVVKERKLKKT